MKKVLNTKDMNITTSDYIKIEDRTPKIENIKIDKFINTFLILIDLMILIILLFAILVVVGIIVGWICIKNGIY